MGYTRLRELRKKKGLTQEEMAKLLGYKGKSGYCMLENGTNKMSLEMAGKIAHILEVDINELFFKNEVHATRTKPIAG